MKPLTFLTYTLAALMLIGAQLPVAAASTTPAIGWIASWDQALTEARQSHKPILLMSGAPDCGGVPGIW